MPKTSEILINVVNASDLPPNIRDGATTYLETLQTEIEALGFSPSNKLISIGEELDTMTEEYTEEEEWEDEDEDDEDDEEDI